MHVDYAKMKQNSLWFSEIKSQMTLVLYVCSVHGITIKYTTKFLKLI